MAVKLNVDAIHIESEYGVETVTFVSNSGPSSQYMLFQNPNGFDEQDVSLGMDKAYVEFCDQLNSQYGGILKVRTSKDSLCITLDDGSHLHKKLGGTAINLIYPDDIPNLEQAINLLACICRQDDIEMTEGKY